MSEPEKDINQIKEERLEKIIEQKVEEKTQKLEKQNQKLKKEIQALKSDSNKISRTNAKASQNEGISRRQFLKKAGLGTAGLAALMSPVSALNVDSNSFSVRTGSDSSGLEEYFSVGENGPVNIENTDLYLNGNDIDDIRNLGSAEGQYINLKNDSISLNFANDERIRFYNYDTESTVLETSGDDVKIPNGNLDLNGNNIVDAGDIGIGTSSPEAPLEIGGLEGYRPDFKVVENLGSSRDWPSIGGGTRKIILVSKHGDADRGEGSTGKIWGSSEHRQLGGYIEWHAQMGSADWANIFWLDYGLYADRNNPPEVERVLVDYDGDTYMALDVSTSGSDWQRWDDVYGSIHENNFEVQVKEEDDVSNIRSWKDNESYSQFLRASFGGEDGFTILDGNFGIGTTSPSSALDVDGSADIHGNLHLATGQSIEDEDGNERMDISSTRTRIYAPADDRPGLRARDGEGGAIFKDGGNTGLMYDDEGDFWFARYISSSSAPGTLELSNAFLNIVSGDTFSGVSNTGIGFGAAGGGESLRLTFEDGNSNHATLYAENGDLIAEDANGNKTTLT